MKRREILGAAVAGLAPFNPWGRAWAGDIAAVTLTGGAATLTESDIRDLAKGLKGDVLLKGDAGYDEARQVWNAMFDKRPALIARCASTADVVRAVQFARGHGLLLAVRGGGHNIAGLSTCEGGMVLDLTRLRGTKIDRAARVARVAGGSLLADLDEAAISQGLVTTAGVVSHTGAGGLTLGGGIGRLQRTYGLTIDNVLGVEIVTADGKVLNANKDENQDLHWGVRGGGGNFGVVTEFQYQLHPFDGKVTSFFFGFNPKEAKSLLANYFEYGASAPDSVYVSANLSMGRDGRQILRVGGCLYGTADQCEAALATIRTLGTVTTERAEVVDYIKLQKSTDASSRFGNYHYAKAGFFGETTKGTIDALVDFFDANPMPGGHMGVLTMGGAVGRVAPEATAYPNRSATQNIDVGGGSPDLAEAEKLMAWGRAYWQAIVDYTATGGFYVNQMVEEGDRRVADNFGGNYQRLKALKTKYDPTNLFRINANIKPA